MQYKFNNNLTNIKPSAIREILKLTADPSIISFAAGNPAAETFPAEQIAQISNEILTTNPISALQYSVTEGYAPLREHLKNLHKSNKTMQDFDDLIITAGATQAIGIAAQILCNKGDKILVENPTFIGSLNAFRVHGLNMTGIDMQDDGVDLSQLESALKNGDVKFFYTIVNFQNPTGITTSLEKRKKIYDLCAKYNCLILEDNPYGDLRFSGDDIPSIKSLDDSGIVVYIRSFSKTIAPGLRVGYCIAPAPVVSKMVLAKQAQDVHTNTHAQIITHKFITEYDFIAHLNFAKTIYASRATCMMNAIDFHFNRELCYNKIDGGLFLWCKLPAGINAADFVKRALDLGVAIIPGDVFALNGGTNSVRLNFSTESLENIEIGVDKLASLM